MKLTFAAPAAGAMIIAAMTFGAPALAENTAADGNAATKCTVTKNGFAWNVCGADEYRSKKAVAGVPGAAPNNPGPNRPESGENEPESISVFGISLGTGPTPFDPQDNGSNPYGGGGDGGR